MKDDQYERSGGGNGGVVYMLVASVGMAAMSLVIKIINLQTNIHVFEVCLWRSFYMAVGCFCHAKLINVSLLEVPKEKRIWVFCRAFFGVLA